MDTFDNNKVPENNVEVIGGEVNAETIPETTTTAQTTETEENELTAEEKAQKETDDAKNEAEKSKEQSEKEKEQNKDKDTAKPFQVSFGKEDKTKEASTTEEKKETLSVTEAEVVNFLKSKGLEVGSVAELSKTVELSEEVKQFQKFVADTGRGHKDFYNSQKNWNEEPKDDTIREFLKMKHDLSDENIEKHLGLLKLTEDDKEYLTDREITQRQLDYDQKYSEALKFMNEKSKEYKTPLGNREFAKPMTKEELVEAHRPYWKRRDKSLENFNEISISLGKLGDIKIPVTQENKDYISNTTQTGEAYINQFKDNEDKPNFINTDKSVEAIFWGNKEFRENAIQRIIEQSHALFLDDFSKTNRNVDLNDAKHREKTTESTSSVEVIGGNGEDPRMGKSILD